jgi:hypothetical protein
MAWTSYKADIEDKALDNQIAANAFANGTAGAAGIGSFLEAQRVDTAMRKARRTEAATRRKEERAQRDADDKFAWIEATVGVAPLRRKR